MYGCENNGSYPSKFWADCSGSGELLGVADGGGIDEEYREMWFRLHLPTLARWA